MCSATTGTPALHATVESTVENKDDSDNNSASSEANGVEDDTLYGCMFATNSNNSILDTWIVLLDSQSTVSIFCNAKFLHNICMSPTKLVVITNGGKQISTMISDLKNFGPVWYNPESIANILSHAANAKTVLD